MGTIAILGAGHIAQALVALWGNSDPCPVRVWARRLPKACSFTVVLRHAQGFAKAGHALALPSLRDTLAEADLVVLTVPTFAREWVLREARPWIPRNAALFTWEGTGAF